MGGCPCLGRRSRTATMRGARCRPRWTCAPLSARWRCPSCRASIWPWASGSPRARRSSATSAPSVAWTTARSATRSIWRRAFKPTPVPGKSSSRSRPTIWYATLSTWAAPARRASRAACSGWRRIAYWAGVRHDVAVRRRCLRPSPGADRARAPSFLLTKRSGVGRHLLRDRLRREGFARRHRTRRHVLVPRSGGEVFRAIAGDGTDEEPRRLQIGQQRHVVVNGGAADGVVVIELVAGILVGDVDD